MAARKIEDASVRVQREIGLRGKLVHFVEMAWPLVVPHSPYIDSWHIHEICEHLEACSRGEIRRLIINVPPGMSKSSIVSVFWPAWEWIRHPELAYLRGSFDPKIGERDAAFCATMFLSPWWRARFGDRFKIPNDWGKSDFANDRGGFMMATSPGGKGMGRHANRHIIDDPTKPQEISDAALEDVLDWRKGTLANRWRDAHGVEVIVMQRLHERDLAGELERAGKHVVLRLPMRFETARKCVTKWGGDRRTEEGELLAPARFDADAVAEKEHEMGGRNSRAVAAQFQQRPAPAGGAIFKEEFFKQWGPIGQPGTGGMILPTTFDVMVQSWDCTFKDAETSDFVVGQIWGRKGADYFLLDQFRKRCNVTATVAAIKAFSKKWPRATRKLIEEKANGNAVADILSKEMAGIELLTPEGGKEARANAVVPLIESGNVYDPPLDTIAGGEAWVRQMYDERTTFPVGTNDDTVDAMSQALLWLYKNRSDFAAAMKRAKEMGVDRLFKENAGGYQESAVQILHEAA